MTLRAVPPLLCPALTRTKALAHPLLGSFWEVVDVIAEQDPAIRAEVYGDSPDE